MQGRELWLVGGALVLGPAIAFPVGLMLGGNRAPPAPRPVPPVAMRQVYSPRLLSDPYFLDQARRGTEALERQCRRSGEYCAEAAAARDWLRRQAAD